jgi:hypothetical protein
MTRRSKASGVAIPEASQNIGPGFYGPQAACRPPTTPLGAMRSIDYATTPSTY